MAEEPGVALYGALRNADVAEVRRALGAGADPNLHAPPHDATVPPLVYFCATAISSEKDEGAMEACLAALLESGASPNPIPGQPAPIRSPLYFAAQSPFPGLVSLLLGANADVNWATWDGHSVLHMACSCNNVENVAVLLAAGANVNARFHQATPLEMTHKDYSRMYAMLLRAGSALPRQIYIEGNQYLLKIQRAGGFRKYEAQVKKSLAATLVPKFPQIPAEVIPTVVEFWAHAGDY